MNVCRPVPCNRRSPPALAASSPPAPTWPTGAHLLLVPTASTLNALSDGSGAAPSAPSDPVGLWEDQSGNGRDLAQTTSGIRGLWDTSPTGVTFDATFRRLVRATDGPAAGAVSIGLVFKLSAVPGVGVFFLLARLAHGSGTGISEVYLCNSAGYTAIHVRCGFGTGVGLGVGAVATLDTGEHTLLVVYDGSGSTTPGAYEIYLDGVALSVIASGSSSGLTGGVTSLGCGEDGGGTPYYPTSGTIRHLGVWARALDAGDVTLWQDQADAIVGPWTPATASASWWVDAPVALPAGRLYTTSIKTTPAVAPGDPVGAWVQEGGLTPDLLQATGTARGALSSLSSGIAAVEFDGASDRLTSAQTFSSGAKSAAVRFQYGTILGAAELDVPLSLGASPTQFRLAMGGGSSTFPGIQWIFDVGAGSTAFRRVAWTPDTAEHTLLICYSGSSHRAWLDGVEQAVVAGNSSVASGTTSVGGISVGSALAAIKIARGFLAPSDLSASQAQVHTWL